MMLSNSANDLDRDEMVVVFRVPAVEDARSNGGSAVDALLLLDGDMVY